MGGLGSVRRTSLETRLGRPIACLHDPGFSVPLTQNQPEIIRLAVMLYVRYLLSLRNVEDLLHERGIEFSHETVRFW